MRAWAEPTGDSSFTSGLRFEVHGDAVGRWPRASFALRSDAVAFAAFESSVKPLSGERVRMIIVDRGPTEGA